MMHDHLRFTLIGVCLVMIIFTVMNHTLSKRRNFSLFFMSLFQVLLLISDKVTRTYDGIADETWFFVIRACKFMAYFTFLLVILAFCQYVRDLFLCDSNTGCSLRGILISEITLLIGILVLSINVFTGIYYYYDENHKYVRAGGYIFSYIIPSLAVTFLAITIVLNRKKLRRKLVLPLFTFTVLPILSAIPQFFIHGVSITSTLMVAMIVLLYTFSIHDTNKLVKEAYATQVETYKKVISQTVEALSEAIDTKDTYTNGHSRRVAKYSRMIAQKAGKTDDECHEIYLIGLLHDVGKIGIPGSIINKDTKLTVEEYEKIKEHTTNGRSILSKIEAMPELVLGAYCHHERYDGTGYPEGLSGEDIPEVARIIAVADAYDAMASKRSYREALPQKKIREELNKGIGTQFDPNFAKIMIDIIDSDTYYQLREA